MAKRNRIPEVETEQGQPADVLIPGLLAEMGSQKAVADRLGLSQSTISSWLKQNGYVPVISWQKESIEK